MLPPITTNNMRKIAIIACIFLLSVMIPTQVVAAQIGILSGKQIDWKQPNEIKIAVTISDNPGIVAMRIFVKYDANILKLKSVENGEIFKTEDALHGKLMSANPYTLTWEDALSQGNIEKNGTLAYLVFEYQDEVGLAETDVYLQIDTNSTINTDLNNAMFSIENIHCKLPIKESPKVASCNHADSAWETVVNASCSVTGQQRRVCHDCGKVLETKALTATGHHFGEWKLQTAATENNPGTEVRVCDECGFKQAHEVSLVTFTVTKPMGSSESSISSGQSNYSTLVEDENYSDSDADALTHTAHNVQSHTESAVLWTVVICVSVAIIIVAVGLIIYKKKGAKR